MAAIDPGDDNFEVNLRQVLGSTALAALFYGVSRRQRHRALPDVVAYGDRTEAVARLAEDLARQNREDSKAVAELRQAAGRTSRLRRAAQLFAFFGRAQEEVVGNRAWRLLEAAAGGDEVRPLTVDESDRLERIGVVIQSPVDEGFEVLASLQPELRPLTESARANASNEERSDAWLRELEARLEALVGPQARCDDPVVRSHCAEVIAIRYLGRVAMNCSSHEVLEADDYGWSP